MSFPRIKTMVIAQRVSHAWNRMHTFSIGKNESSVLQVKKILAVGWLYFMHLQDKSNNI